MQDLVTLHELNRKSIAATTTKQIAEYTGKRHDNILRDVEDLLKTGQFNHLNFEESSYVNAQNKKQKMYVMDRTLTDVLLMGFTGKEAVKWKIAYSKSFQTMEKKIEDSRDHAVEFFKPFVLDLPEKWQRCFPKEYFDGVCKIYRFKKVNQNYPGFVGTFTNNYVYTPLCKSNGILLNLLREKNPVVMAKDGKKHRHNRFHQYLDEIGVVNLQMHVNQITGLLKAAVDKKNFEEMFSRVFHANDILLECFPAKQPEKKKELVILRESYMF